MSTKEEFFRQKIANFIIFIEQKIGKDNNVYKEFVAYSKDMKLFLQGLMKLSQYATPSEDNKKSFSPEVIQKYLEYQGVKKQLPPEDIVKINRYLDMFIDVLEN